MGMAASLVFSGPQTSPWRRRRKMLLGQVVQSSRRYTSCLYEKFELFSMKKDTSFH